MLKTPHINAEKNSIAKTVLMPGDPLRSAFIAEKYLKDAVLFNNVRGVQGYTGLFKGERISVMASGMGVPSIGIYSYELFNYSDVENIIRIGSAGGVADDIKIRDLVIAQGACTNSNYATQFRLPGTIAPIADFELLLKMYETAKAKDMNVRVGNVLTTDCFYDDANSLDEWKKMNVLAVEMESAALYMNAARAGKRALAICTISDLPLKGISLSAEERQTSFLDMVELALDTCIVL